MRNSIRACYDFIRAVPKSNCNWTHSDSQHSKAILHLSCTVDDAELYLFQYENEMVEKCPWPTGASANSWQINNILWHLNFAL